MTLPASGTISLNQVNTELLRDSENIVDLNETPVRSLFNIPAGTISMSDGHGASNIFEFSTNYSIYGAFNLRNACISAGWDGNKPVVATINAAPDPAGNSQIQGIPGLTIDGSFPQGVTLFIYGNVTGLGGPGGSGADVYPTISAPTAGGPGNTALYVRTAVKIYNYGTIAAGGGGGGGGGYNLHTYYEPPAGKGSGQNIILLAPGGGGDFGSTAKQFEVHAGGRGGRIYIDGFDPPAGYFSGGSGRLSLGPDYYVSGDTGTYQGGPAGYIVNSNVPAMNAYHYPGQTEANSAGFSATYSSSSTVSGILYGYAGGASNPAGAAGSNGTGNSGLGGAGAGGAGGKAVDGNAYITWKFFGTIYGLIV